MKPPSTSSIFAARRDASANRTPREPYGERHKDRTSGYPVNDSSLQQKRGTANSHEMKKVKPRHLLQDLKASRKGLICIDIGTIYISIVVSIDYETTLHPRCLPSTCRCLPSTLSLGLVAEELQQLVLQHNIGGFVLGNCLSSQYKKKAKETESFVEDLSATGLFKDMKYIHWTSSLVYQLLGSPMCNHTYNFFVRCKVSSFDIKRVKKDADMRVAAGVLQSYLIEMDWGASSGDDPSDLETSLYELVYGS